MSSSRYSCVRLLVYCIHQLVTTPTLWFHVIKTRQSLLRHPALVTNARIVDVAFWGYTLSMKTAVSIPDDVFQGAERLARRTKRSRSRLFSDALREYLARHSPEEVTEAMNKACDEIGETEDAFVSAAAARILKRSEW